MRKNILFIGALILSLCLPFSLYAEELKITTYYPSPAGVYKNLFVQDTEQSQDKNITVAKSLQGEWNNEMFVCDKDGNGSQSSGDGTCDNPGITTDCKNVIKVKCGAGKVVYTPAIVSGQGHPFKDGAANAGLVSFSFTREYAVSDSGVLKVPDYSAPDSPGSLTDNIVPWTSGAGVMGVSDSTGVYGIGINTHPGVYGYSRFQYGVLGTTGKGGMAGVAAVVGSNMTTLNSNYNINAMYAQTEGGAIGHHAAYWAASYDGGLGFYGWKPGWGCYNGTGKNCMAPGTLFQVNKWSTDRAPALVVGTSSALDASTYGLAQEIYGAVKILHRPPAPADRVVGADPANTAGLDVNVWSNAPGADIIPAAIFTGGGGPTNVNSVLVKGGPLDVKSTILTPVITVADKITTKDLDANGNIKTISFTMTNGAAADKVLVSDDIGNASWKKLVCTPTNTLETAKGKITVDGTEYTVDIEYLKCTAVECKLEP